jgi:hypothetical protein
MGYYRLKHTFSAGELSPLMGARVDFDRHQDGCKTLRNMYSTAQGPVSRRPGFKFIYSLNDIDIDPAHPEVRLIPFIFNEVQAYVLIFYNHKTSGKPRIVFGSGSGLVTYGSPVITECPTGTPVTRTAGDIVYLELDTSWNIEDFDWAQSGDYMYIAQSGRQPCVIRRYSDYCWTLSNITFASQPSDWSSLLGWPERVAFHQQRLVYAATTNKRQTVWASKAGSFHDFGTNSPLLASDSLSFTLDSGTQNRIQWMISGKSLDIGTLGNEWTVSGNGQAALTPSNILAQRQTNNGSEPNKPLKVGVTTLFVERHGRAVNEFTYDYTYDSYLSTDMSILAPHMTEYYSIVDWTFQQTPEGIIWCVREDGDLLGITYQKQHKVIGWHHHDTLGAFKAVTCIPGNTREDDVWVVVKRVINSVDKYYVEKMDDFFTSTEAEWSRYLDSFLEYTGTPISTVTGLSHLEGITVSILTDGAVHPPLVVTSGSITLNDSYANIVVGIPFTSEVRPYLSDISRRDGTTLGRMQRIIRLSIDFYRTLGVFIGVVDPEDGERVEELPFRVPGDDTGTQVPLFSGIYNVDFPEGCSREPDYFIRQTQPLPLTVRGVVDLVEVND